MGAGASYLGGAGTPITDGLPKTGSGVLVAFGAPSLVELFADVEMFVLGAAAEVKTVGVFRVSDLALSPFGSSRFNSLFGTGLAFVGVSFFGDSFFASLLVAVDLMAGKSSSAGPRRDCALAVAAADPQNISPNTNAKKTLDIRHSTSQCFDANALLAGQWPIKSLR